MSLKSAVWTGFFIGSTIGSALPVVFHQDLLSFWSVIWSTVGGVAGVWAGYKFGQNYL